MKAENKPLEILKTLMYEYMVDGTDMVVTPARYQQICDGIHILEKQEKELLEPDITAEAILDKHLFNKFDSVDRKTFLDAMHEYANQFPPMQLLADFRIECQKYPDEPVEVLYELAKGWYNLRNFKNDPLDKPLEL